MVFGVKDTVHEVDPPPLQPALDPLAKQMSEYTAPDFVVAVFAPEVQLADAPPDVTGHYESMGGAQSQSQVKHLPVQSS